MKSFPLVLLVACVAFSSTAVLSASEMQVKGKPVTYGVHDRGAYLGVGLRDLTPDSTAQLKLKENHGVEVIAVDRDGPSANALQEHDVIQAVNGQRVESGAQLRRILHELAAGKKANVDVVRDGAVVHAQVVLGERTAQARVTIPDLNLQLPDMSGLENGISPVIAMGDPLADVDLDVQLHGALAGAQVESVGPQLARYFGAKDGAGVLVTEVRPETPAAKGGMHAGDLIVRAAGQATPSRLEWDRRLRENRGKSIDVVVLREHREQKLTLSLSATTSSSLDMPEIDTAALEAKLQDLDATLQATQQIREQAMQAASDAINSEEFKQSMAEVNSDATKQAMDEARKAMDSDEVKKALAEAQQAVADAKNTWTAEDQAKLKAEIDSETAQAAAEAQKAMDSEEVKKALAEAQAEVANAKNAWTAEDQKKLMDEVQRELDQLKPMD